MAGALCELSYVRLTDYPGSIDGEYAYPLLGFDLDALIGEHQPVSSCNVAEVAVDVKPRSCPNPLNVKSKGVLPVAILGTDTFDVTQVDPESVQLEGVAPLRWDLEDVATPFVPFTGKASCQDCTSDGLDGYMDLTLKFDKQAVVAAIGLVNDGDCFVLTLTGALDDDTLITGEDVVRILKKGKNNGG